MSKALSKRPERRYASAAELAADIRHLLRFEPVVAGPQSGRYRLSKFVRRHRLAVVALLLIATTLVAGVVAARLEAARANREAERARFEARSAEAALSAFEELFAGADPFGIDLLADPASQARRGPETTVRQVLDEQAERLWTQFDDRPLMRARLMGSLGGLYVSLGLYDDAEALLRESWDLRRDTHGPLHDESIESRHRLAVVYVNQRRMEEAERLQQGLLEDHLRAFGESDPRTLQAMTNLAAIYGLQDRYEESEALLNETLRLYESQPELAWSASHCLNTLGSLLQVQGRVAEA